MAARYVSFSKFFRNPPTLIYICRGFNDILKTDRERYGAEEGYVIKDTIADEWQRVDDVIIAGMGVE